MTLGLSNWPGGAEPVWAGLGRKSRQALKREPSARSRVLRLGTDLAGKELGRSAFVRNAVILLRGTAGDGALGLTERGNLSRTAVAALRESMTWPDMEAAEELQAGKALREQDVGELHLLRVLAETGKLVERRGLRLEATRLGQDMLAEGRQGALQALLFRLVFWQADLSRFMGGVPRWLPDRWPQDDAGVVLWSLSRAAGEWQGADTLAALCTVPDDWMPEADWNPQAMLFAMRILRPLLWFGLVEFWEPDDVFEIQKRPVRSLPVVRRPAPGQRCSGQLAGAGLGGWPARHKPQGFLCWVVWNVDGHGIGSRARNDRVDVVAAVGRAIVGRKPVPGPYPSFVSTILHRLDPTLEIHLSYV